MTKNESLERLTDLAGLRATLIGLGARTNVELARYLSRHGAAVTISDRKPAEELQLEIGLLGDLPVRLSLGGHREEDVLDADVLFVTPGVPRELPVLVAARSAGVRISSEIELLFEKCQSPIVAVTGSSGKTTTTTLVGRMLEADGRRTYVGGNIGVPLINRLEEIGARSWVVLELSSFQLEAMTVSPHIGAILNVTPNHLDRHKTMEAYTQAKLNVLRHQRSTDHAVLGLDDPIASSLASACPGQVSFFSRQTAVDEGTFSRTGELVLRRDGAETIVCRVDDVRLRGEHNLLNVLAAAAIAGAAGVSSEAMARVATSFSGVEHRLEPVRTVMGVTYYNDSIATTPERTCAALRAFTQPIVLLAGGLSKHLPLDEMVALIAERCRAVVTFGDAAAEIAAAVGARPAAAHIVVRHGGDLESATRLARDLAKPGDVVLLSPSGTSFDAFRDFEARGLRFKEIVAGL